MDLSNDHGAAPRALELFAAQGSAHTQRAAEAVHLSALWTELVRGLCKVEEATFNEHSCALVVSRGQPSAGRDGGLSKRHAVVLERSLLEGARKSLAIDFGVSPSSVAEVLKHGLRFMGLSCWPSRMPLVLVLAAHAQRARELDHAVVARVAESQHFSRQSISVARPDNELGDRLTAAEFAVTRLLVEGKSYAEMARLRQTSARTVANQLASAFRRLGVSGRAELLCLLASRKVASWRISTLGRVSPVPVDSASGYLRVAGWQGR